MLRAWSVIGLAGGTASTLVFARLASEALFRRDVRDAAILVPVLMSFVVLLFVLSRLGGLVR